MTEKDKGGGAAAGLAPWGDQGPGCMPHQGWRRRRLRGPLQRQQQRQRAMPPTLLALLLLQLALHCLVGQWGLVAADDPPVTVLEPGVRVDGSVAAKSYAYYEITQPRESVGRRDDLLVTATPMSGDPDLYLSLKDHLPIPDNARYEWTATHLGQDSIIVAAEDPNNCLHQQAGSGSHGAGCVYRIAVYGYQPSLFTLVARFNSSEPLPLTLGQPQGDQVMAGTFRQYSFEITPAVTRMPDGTPADVQVLVTPLNGDPDCYATLGPAPGSRPTSDNYHFKSASWGQSQDRIVLRPNDPEFQRRCPQSRCSLRVGVYGFHDAAFGILVSTHAEPVQLQENMPFQNAGLAPGGYQRFSLPWRGAAEGHEDVLITLNRQSGGRLRLFASCRTAWPNATDYDWALDAGVLPLLRIEGGEGKRKGCEPGTSTLTLAVLADGPGAAAFSLLASMDSPTSVPLLVPGLPTFGEVGYNAMQYYSIRMGSAGYEDMDIVLSARSGEVDIFLSTDWDARPKLDPATGQVTGALLSSTEDGDDRLSVRHGRFPACDAHGSGNGGCFYIVGVLGRRTTANTFSLVASKVDATVTLEEGVAVRDAVNSKNTNWYRFSVMDADTDVSISVTPFSGDPDIYAAFGNAKPTKDEHTWASRGFGADTLTIQAAALKEHCSPNPALGVGCDLGIGVFAWSNTSYSIMATLNRGWASPIALTPGRPQAGYVAKGLYRYYSVRIPGSGSGEQQPVVRVSLLPEGDGDQDLYVSLSRDKEPGKESFDFKSTSWASVDEIVIAPGDPKYCNDPQGCDAYIGVFGYEAGAYTLTASLSTRQQELQLGTPVRGTVGANGTNYYQIGWSSAADDLLVTLTPLVGSKPELYLSCRYPFPNATAHSWGLRTREASVLRINATEAEGGGPGCHWPGKLWLAVVGEKGRGMATYSLTVATDASTTMPVLIPGVPLAGEMGLNKFSYYQLRGMAGGYVDYDIICTVTSGEVDLYVSNSIAGRPVWDPHTARVANYTLKSEERGSDRIRINHSHFTDGDCGAAGGDGAGGGGECIYVVGVLGRGLFGRNAYSIVAKKRASTIELADGLAVRDYVGPDHYEYFSVKVTDPEADLTIAVTPFTGDPDVFVSPAPHSRPNSTNHEWAARGFGKDSLTIQAEEMKEHCTPDPVRGVTCEYYIGVLGWTNTSFSIMASLNRGWEDPMWLFAGQSQAGEVAKGSYQYYQFYVPAEATELRFVLTPASIWGEDEDYLDWDSEAEEPDQDLFLSTSREKQPGESNFDLTSQTWAGVDEIVFSEEEAGEAWCTDCLVYLSVYGYSGDTGQYTLRVETGVSELQSAVPVTGHVTTGGSNVYKIWNGDPHAHILVSATTLSGDADIFVMAETYQNESLVLPSRAQFHWKSSRVGDDVVEILPSDEHFCFDCSYIVTVEGWSNTSYTLTATVEELAVIPLAGGRPQTSFVDAGQAKYFSALLGSSAEDLRIALTVLSGAAELYVGDDLNRLPQANDSSTYSHTTHGRGRGTGEGSSSLVIPGPHRNRTRFAIGVVGLEDGTVFSISASFSQMPILLQEGVPLQQTVSAGRNEFFVYRIASREDITVTVTALQGDPDILASTSSRDRPACTRAPGADPWSFECGNYTWIAQSFASDQLVILHDAPCEEVGSTRVNPDRCRAQDALAPGKLLHVTVFGYDEEDTTFTITLTTGGGQTTLLPGQPQHGATRAGAVCRSRTAAGTCDTSNAGGRGTSWDRASVSYFKFLVAPPNALYGEKDAHVSLVLEPQCNATAQPCAPGCPCDPLTVYVSSCPESRCTVDDQYPNPFRFQLQQQAAAGYSTLFIARDPLNPGNGFCDPKQAKEPCLYYVTVYHREAADERGGDAASNVGFTLTAATPSDVTILPTRTRPAPPDGVVTSGLATVDAGSKHYQMYAQRGGSVLLTLEACTGDVSLAVCDGSCAGLYPTEADYRFYADATRACTRGGCRPSTDPVPRIGLDRADVDAFFLAVNGSGTFRIRAETTDPATGKAIAPLLTAPSHTPHPSLRDVGTDRVTVTWRPATLTMPGRPGSKRAVTPADVRYRVYALEEGRIQQESTAPRPVLHTVCGVEHYASLTAGGGGTRAGLAEGGATSYVMTGLAPGTQYRFLVAAVCDAACLRAVARATPASTLDIPCGGAVPCQDQSTLYAPAQLTTPGSAAAARWRRFLGVGGLSLTATFLLLGLTVALLTAGLLWRQNRRLEGQLSYEMTTSPRGNESPTFGLPATGRGPASAGGGNGSGSRSGGGYERLLGQGEREEAEMESRAGYRLPPVQEEGDEEDTTLV